MKSYTCFTCGESVPLTVEGCADHALIHAEELYATRGLRYDPVLGAAVPVDKDSLEYLSIMERVEKIQLRFGY
jgi:hypothetical protein